MEHATQFPEQYSKVASVQKKVRGPCLRLRLAVPQLLEKEMQPQTQHTEAAFRLAKEADATPMALVSAF